MLYEESGAGWSNRIYLPEQDSGAAPLGSDLRLTAMGRFASAGQLRFQQVAQVPAVHVVSSGRGVMNAAGVDHELAPGDVFAFFPGVHYRYRDVRRQPWRYTWCVLQGGAVRAALERAGLTERTPRLTGDFAAPLEGLFLETEQACARGPAPEFFAACAAWRLLDRLQRLTAGGPAAPDADAVASARALIDLRFMTRMSIEEIARQLGIDRSTLFRRFRERYGVAPKRYLDLVRLAHARRLLRDTGATVRTVAALSGFEDSRYFSRTYRRAYGVAPSRDRREQPPLHRPPPTGGPGTGLTDIPPGCREGNEGRSQAARRRPETRNRP